MALTQPVFRSVPGEAQAARLVSSIGSCPLAATTRPRNRLQPRQIDRDGNHFDHRGDEVDRTAIDHEKDGGAVTHRWIDAHRIEHGLWPGNGDLGWSEEEESIELRTS